MTGRQLIDTGLVSELMCIPNTSMFENYKFATFD